jgi:hypothetical protein
MPLAEESDMSLPESWRPVVGFEGLYEVSDQGRVRNMATGRGRRGIGYVLKPKKHQDGYLFVILWDNAEIITKKIHHLMMEAFVGPRGELIVHHKDENPANNVLSNLEYVTYSWHNHFHGGRR